MHRVRRHDLAPRVELLPMIDVIFLLLTFFIYAMTMMVQAQVLPVRLTTVGTGQQAQPADIAAITVDDTGRLYFNRDPIAEDALRDKLAAIAGQDDPPTLFLAMQSPPSPEGSQGTESPGSAAGKLPGAGASGGGVDRGPLLIRLIDMVRTAGLRDFQIVGPPSSGGEK